MFVKRIKKVVSDTSVGKLMQPFYVQVSQRWRMLRNVSYDARRFMRWSFTVRKPLTQDQLQASMVMTYHSLEKGLAFSTPKSGFGRAKADSVSYTHLTLPTIYSV